MTPAQFIARWKGSALSERAGAHAHFDDLCELLDVNKPRDTAQGIPTGPQADAIAAAAKRLNELRENWLNPPEWTERIPKSCPATLTASSPNPATKPI